MRLALVAKGLNSTIYLVININKFHNFQQGIQLELIRLKFTLSG